MKNVLPSENKKKLTQTMKPFLMALLAISTARILSCRTQQFLGNTKKPFEEALRLKRLGIDKIKDTEIDETKDENEEESALNYSDYEDKVNDYLFFDKFLDDKEEEKNKEIIIFDGRKPKDCDGPEFDDFFGEFCPLYVHRNKRGASNDFLAGMLSSGEKFIDGNIGGSVTTFLKTLIQPMFHYFIKSDNDPVMEKFTNRFIPETTLQGSSNGLRMIGSAQDGDGNAVWETLHKNTETWNPRSSWTHIKDRSDAEQRTFKQFIPTILAIDKTISQRLKDLSLVMTTLSTSLHDTLIDSMNKGFKSASGTFKNLKEDHEDLIKILSTIFGVLEDDITAEMKIAAVSVILIFIVLHSGLNYWQNRSLQLRCGRLEDIVREIKQDMDESTIREARVEQKLDGMIQERNTIAASIARAVEQAVRDASGANRLRRSLHQPEKRAHMDDSQVRNYIPSQPSLGFNGNHVQNSSTFVLVPQ